jgi:hypothetical protein
MFALGDYCMLKKWSWSSAFAVTLLVLMATVIATSLQSQTSVPAQSNVPHPDSSQEDAIKRSLPPGEGRDILIKTCSGCHLLSVVTTQRKSESDWTDTVIEMRNRGASASDDDLEKIVGYLAKNFGPKAAPAKVNFNSGSASNVAIGLGLRQTEVHASVDFRGKQRRLKDFPGSNGCPLLNGVRMTPIEERLECY